MWTRGASLPPVARLSVKLFQRQTLLALCTKTGVQEHRENKSFLPYTFPSRNFSLSTSCWKGHNKWSNIKHIKGARDAEIAKKNLLFRNRIVLAIKQNGNNTNTDSNYVLRKVLEEAKSQMVPKASIDKAVKDAKGEKGDLDIEIMWEVRGPGRAAVLVELLCKNRSMVQSQINPVLRKCGSSHEQGLVNMFEKKGVILTSLKAGASLDDAETDGIEVGAEEVVLANEEESDQLLEFTTDPGEMAIVQQGMTGLGYKIEEAKVVYIPQTTAQLSPLESGALTRLVNSLEELSIVMGVHHNAE